MQVLPSLVAGGAERGAVDVAIALVKAGGKAIVVSGGGPLVYELERGKAKHIKLDVATKNPLKIWRNGKILAQLIGTHKVDIIHARSRAPAWSAYRAARLTGIRFMTTFHAAYKFKSKSKQRYNSVMAKGDRVIAISDFIAHHIAENYAIDPSRIVIIPRGVDTDKFNRAKVSEERMIRLLQAWRVPDHLPVLLMPARLSRIKGHSVLIEALALRRQSGASDVYSVIVGATDKDRPYRRELEALIEARGLEGLVRIVDHCDDMPAAYGVATLVVAPSIVPEGFGRVPVEAQAMGKPVIASAIGGFLETILPGETGLLVPPGEAAALAEAIESLLALSEDRRVEIGLHAEQSVQARFTKQAMCQATLGVYAELGGQEYPITTV
jgi:glycosyltransferase involved in cell wall biosynthesis